VNRALYEATEESQWVGGMRKRMRGVDEVVACLDRFFCWKLLLV